MKIKLLYILILFILIVCSISYADHTIFYQNTFQSSDDWTDPNNDCQVETIGSFTGLHLATVVTGRICYKTLPSLTIGNVTAQYTVKVLGKETGNGHDSFGFFDDATPQPDPNIGTQGSVASNGYRFRQDNGADCAIPTVVGGVYAIKYSFDFDNDNAILYVNGSHICNRTAWNTANLEIFGHRRGSVPNEDYIVKDMFLCNTTVYGEGCVSTPTVSFVTPTETSGANINKNYTFINVTTDININFAYLEWNGTNESMSNITALNWFLNKTNLTDGTYLYKVYGNSSDGHWGVSEIRNITIDTNFPTITWTFPATNISCTNNFTIDVLAQDNNLFRVNVTMYNESFDILWNVLYDNISTTSQVVSLDTNFTQGFQNYTLEVCANDDHTYGSLRGLKYSIENDGILFYANNGYKKLQVGYFNNGVKTLTENQINNFNVSFQVIKRKGEFKFNLSFIKPVQDYKFGFIIDKKHLTIIQKGHVVYKDWYIDFFDMENSGFPLSTTSNGTHYFIYSNSQYCNVADGEICIFDPIVGGLNEICENRTINHIPAPPPAPVSDIELKLFNPADLTIIGMLGIGMLIFLMFGFLVIGLIWRIMLFILASCIILLVLGMIVFLTFSIYLGMILVVLSLVSVVVVGLGIAKQ